MMIRCPGRVFERKSADEFFISLLRANEQTKMRARQHPAGMANRAVANKAASEPVVAIAIGTAVYLKTGNWRDG
jgi:hypothetical protein